jgi:branched-chain amino acid transport system ATP-binding protein/urea transport system ATP-binding protein
MLRVDNLYAGYQAGSNVLQGLSFELAERELTALMGRNGMGKTALLRAIMGHLTISAGTINFSGHAITGAEPYRISQLGIAYVPQGREIFADFTVEQNLLLGLFGKPGLAAKVPGWIYDYFPILAARRRQRGGTLSGGEQQQLAIARALVSRPRLLLLDEPSEGIQPSIVQSIAEQLRAIADREGLTVLVVEQNLDLVLRLARRCLFIENGRIVGQIGVAELHHDNSLLQRYLSV